MSRCDYDGVFYRVFCVTLMATAFTFTIILTNVFIDIDGLLAKRAKQSHENEQNDHEATTPVSTYERTDENVNDKNDIDDHQESDIRTKRSLDTSNFLIYMKRHKMKKIYTKQLEKLLEKLNIQDEESVNYDLNEDTPAPTTVETLRYLKHHSANIMKKNIVHPNSNNIVPGNKVKKHLHRKHSHSKVLKEENKSDNSSNTEKFILNKNVKLEKLKIEPTRNLSKANSTSDNTTPTLKLNKESIAILGTKYKTITSNLRDISEKLFSQTSEKTKVISSSLNEKVPLHLNGLKKVVQLYDDKKQSDFNLAENDVSLILKLQEWDQQYKNKQLPNISGNNKQINDSHPLKTPENNSIREGKISMDMQNNQKNRSKRHIKLRHDDIEPSTPRIKPSRNGLKKTDDDLYVEIETHFDGKGAKGERKKKLVRNLIDRIQKAIRSDADSPDTDNRFKKNSHHLEIKKRIQNPIKHKHEKQGKYMSRYNSVEHRKLNPINDIYEMKDISRDLKDVSLEENLEEPYVFPDSNTPTLSNLEKSLEVNNAEINTVLNSGVPQRFQVPLNTDDAIGQTKVQNTFADTGNVTLFIKDIDGSGFAVGFNQYMDEPPDVESMKIFSGLENVIKNYHDNYDQNPSVNDIDNSVEKRHELTKRNVPFDQNKRVLLRRAIRELENDDYQSNAYKIIYDKNFLPYENYQDILEIPNKNAISSNYEYKLRNYNYNPKNIKIITKDIKIKALPLVLDDDIFEKKLKPSEILNLANLLLNNERKKRSVNVQRITNLKSRIKLNRYLNTKAMQSKKVFLKNKRSKRQIDKIRIIASDRLHRSMRNSDENIYIVPDGNMFGHRDVLREIELPESDIGDDRGEDQVADTLPYNVEEPNLDQNYHPNIFGPKYSRNPLMSKYPHIFTDGGSTGSKEVHFGNENAYLIGDNKPPLGFDHLLGIHAASENIGSNEKHLPDIVDAILPIQASPSKNSYKVTVKILPKNLTNANSGFKEMHTVINKTYNNNGVQYYSLVNVSEISKIEKINKSKDFLSHQFGKLSNDNQEQEDKMKFLLGLQKMKIEQQLQNLNKEKDNLEAMLREKPNAKEFSDLFKGVMEKKTNVKQLNNAPYINHVAIQQVTPMEQTTTPKIITTTITIPPTTVPTVEPKPEPVTTKIETSIKENQNFTNEILTRINKNTDILQSFLMKLVEKLDPAPRYQTTTQQTIVDHVTEDTRHLKAHAELTKDLGMNLHHMHDSFFIDHHHKNDTHYAIPFVYAYQQPYLSPNKPLLPMAKVVYHGHIHTNTIHKHTGDNWKYNPNNSKLTHSQMKHDNSTRFFIDPMARDNAAAPPKPNEMLDCKHNHTATINIR